MRYNGFSLTREKNRIQSIESNLKELKRAHSELLPIFTQIDRTRRHLELNIAGLEDQLVKLRQGQLELRVQDEPAVDDDYDETMGF